MSTIHEAYGPARFEGTREELRGGEYLGGTARPDLFEAGDIITCVGGEEVWPHAYYYDPELRIEGSSSWVRVASGWHRLDRKAPAR